MDKRAFMHNVYRDHWQWRPDLQNARDIRQSATIPASAWEFARNKKTLHSACAPWKKQQPLRNLLVLELSRKLPHTGSMTLPIAPGLVPASVHIVHETICRLDLSRPLIVGQATEDLSDPKPTHVLMRRTSFP